jgi:L-ribulokinase
VLNKPVLVPEGDVTSLGSAIMAFMAAGAFESIEAAQQALCPRYRAIEPDARDGAAYEQLYALYNKLYFAFGKPGSEAVAIGEVLPALRRLAAQVRVAQASASSGELQFAGLSAEAGSGTLKRAPLGGQA